MLTPRKTRALNPQRKKKFSLKQIAAGFGGKRRQASMKGKRRHAHAAPNPKKRRASSKPKRRVTAKKRNSTKVVYRTKYKTRTRKVYIEKPRRKVKAKRSNPKRRKSVNPYLMTLAPVMNPHKRKKRRNKTMAKPKRRVSAKRAGKRNPTRRRTGKRNSHRPRGSRNPFGQPSATIAKTGFGILLGVGGAKILPRSYPANMTATPMMSIVSTAITAGILAWVAQKFIPGAIANGVLYGGAAQTLNVAINAFAPPSLSQYTSLGDFVAGGFPLPQGPVRYALAAAPMEAPNGSQVNVGAFGKAW